MTNSVMFSYEFAFYYRIFFTQHKLNIEYFIKQITLRSCCLCFDFTTSEEEDGIQNGQHEIARMRRME